MCYAFIISKLLMVVFVIFRHCSRLLMSVIGGEPIWHERLSDHSDRPCVAKHLSSRKSISLLYRQHAMFISVVTHETKTGVTRAILRARFCCAILTHQNQILLSK